MRRRRFERENFAARKTGVFKHPPQFGESIGAPAGIAKLNRAARRTATPNLRAFSVLKSTLKQGIGKKVDKSLPSGRKKMLTF
jgi:hypothetical protein